MHAPACFSRLQNCRIPVVGILLVIAVVSYFVLANLAEEIRSLSDSDKILLGQASLFMATRGVSECVMAGFVVSALLFRRLVVRGRDLFTWCCVLAVLAYTGVVCWFLIIPLLRLYSLRV